MAVRFDASGDSLTSSTSLPTSQDRSFSFWFYLATDRNDYTAFLSLGSTYDAGYFFFLGQNNASDMILIDNGGGASSLGSTALVTSTWYHVGVQYLSSATDIYVFLTPFGSAPSTTAEVSNTSFSINNAVTPTYLGTDAFSEYLNGRIYNFKQWDGVALSAADLANEVYSFRPVYLANLYRWTPLLPGTSERLRDVSGNGRNWTANGTLADEDSPFIGGRLWPSRMVFPGEAPPPPSGNPWYIYAQQH